MEAFQVNCMLLLKDLMTCKLLLNLSAVDPDQLAISDQGQSQNDNAT